MQYPICIGGRRLYRHRHSDPDIPGATPGTVSWQAYNAAVEVVHILLQEMAAEGMIPMPTSVANHHGNEAYAAMGWGMLERTSRPSGKVRDWSYAPCSAGKVIQRHRPLCA
jgi:hypothetical protein